MGKSCCVKGCRNATESYKFCGVSFHRIPQEENLRAKWLKGIGLNERDLTNKKAQVCSKHFKVTDFKPTFLAKLKEDAVPFVEGGEVILVNQEKFDRIKIMAPDDVKQELSNSSNSAFETVDLLEDSSEELEETPSESIVHQNVGHQRGGVEYYEKAVQTLAYMGPKEEELRLKVKSLEAKLKRREADIESLEKQVKKRSKGQPEIESLEKELKKSLEREKRLEQILKDMCADTS